MKQIPFFLLIAVLAFGCGRKAKSKLERKGFSVSRSDSGDEDDKPKGLKADSLMFPTRPGNVLLTGNEDHRLVPVFKVNVDPENKRFFTGSISFHRDWKDYEPGDNWNQNFLPGLAVANGYNLVNLTHVHLLPISQRRLFPQPVLIWNVYYPAPTADSLKGQPILRDYYLVSCYDEDTNEDGYINSSDLRRFYHFNKDGEEQGTLVPKDYSVMSCTYDRANDALYIKARHDDNRNGQMDPLERIDIFLVYLVLPTEGQLVYN